MLRKEGRRERGKKEGRKGDGLKEKRGRGEDCKGVRKRSNLKGERDEERGWLTVRGKTRNKLAHAKVREMLRCSGKNKSHGQGQDTLWKH